MSDNNGSVLDTLFAFAAFAMFIFMIPAFLFGVIGFEIGKAIYDINIVKWSLGGFCTGMGYFFWHEGFKPFMYRLGVNPFITYVLMYGLSLAGFWFLVEGFGIKNPLAIVILGLAGMLVQWAFSS